MKATWVFETVIYVWLPFRTCRKVCNSVRNKALGLQMTLTMASMVRMTRLMSEMYALSSSAWKIGSLDVSWGLVGCFAVRNLDSRLKNSFLGNMSYDSVRGLVWVDLPDDRDYSKLGLSGGLVNKMTAIEKWRFWISYSNVLAVEILIFCKRRSGVPFDLHLMRCESEFVLFYSWCWVSFGIFSYAKILSPAFAQVLS